MAITNGIKHEPVHIESCVECSYSGEAKYKLLISNNALQARCPECDKFITNIKYDRRSKDQIRRDKIQTWLESRA